MRCENIKCPYYRKPGKRDYVDRMIGVQRLMGGCNFGYCKLKKKKR